MNKLHTPSAHKPIEVLVIEDNTLVRKVVCQLLTLYGYKTDAAATGKLGIQMAQQHQYDCILV
ncbi:MAG TPA: response regulator, partial [Gammaproteobacteria bacterium]|nr:response regulator [Gammaproteobacteria bacterium]